MFNNFISIFTDFEKTKILKFVIKCFSNLLPQNCLKNTNMAKIVNLIIMNHDGISFKK